MTMSALVLFCFLCIFSLSAFSIDESAVAEDKLPLRDLSFNTLLSASRRFAVKGASAVQRHSLAGWAGTLTVSVESLTGIPVTAADYPFRIDFYSAPKPGIKLYIPKPGSALTGNNAQVRMTLYDPENLMGLDVEKAFVTLIVNHYAAYLSENRIWTRAPSWLAEGIHGNLSAERRNNASVGFASLDDENAVSLDAIMKILNEEVRRDDRSLFAVFFLDWLRHVKPDKQLFELLFKRCSASNEYEYFLSREFLAALLGDNVDLDLEWSKWVLKQSRIVRIPGTTRILNIKSLHRALLLSSGQSGIPQQVIIPDGSGFRALVGFRSESWIPEFRSRKRLELIGIGLGRGKEFESIVKSYCGFLEDLRGDKSDSDLYSELDMLEKRLSDLELGLKNGENRQNGGKD